MSMLRRLWTLLHLILLEIGANKRVYEYRVCARNLMKSAGKAELELMEIVDDDDSGQSFSLPAEMRKRWVTDKATKSSFHLYIDHTRSWS